MEQDFGNAGQGDGPHRSSPQGMHAPGESWPQLCAALTCTRLSRASPCTQEPCPAPRLPQTLQGLAPDSPTAPQGRRARQIAQQTSPPLQLNGQSQPACVYPRGVG